MINQDPYSNRVEPSGAHTTIVPDHTSLDKWLSELPYGIKKQVTKNWVQIRNRDVTQEIGDELWQRESRREAQANAFVRDFLGEIKDLPISLSANDKEICVYADEVARNFRELNRLGRLSDFVSIEKRLAKMGVEIYSEDEGGVRARIQDPMFWRRYTRKTLARKIEKLGRNSLGYVHRRAQLYVSDDSVKRWLQQNVRNRAMLEACIAINQLGQEFTLLELMEKSTANPAIRRAELMTRIAGFEQIARDLGHSGEFMTLTCPSRFHARLSVSGRKNPKFDGSDPTEAAQYLQKIWSRVTSELARLEIKIYGFRVVEPHHDGTPHWHGLFFMPPEHVEIFRRIVAKHACRENRQELGLSYVETKKEANAIARIQQAKIIADKKYTKIPSIASLESKITVEVNFWKNPTSRVWRSISPRIEFKPIDWSRGTAAGYIAKYIAKNIDGINNSGEDLGLDFEANGATVVETAVRVRAWASVWCIRQFQQIGGAPVTIWRELRRLNYENDAESQTTLLSAAFAADKGNWAKFCILMGGIEKRRKDQLLGLYKTEEIRLNKYGEPAADKTLGVVERETGFFQVTREYQWEVKINRKDVLLNFVVEGDAWTCVNNSTKNRLEDKPHQTKSVDWTNYNRKELPLKKFGELQQKRQSSLNINHDIVIQEAQESAQRAKEAIEADLLFKKLEKMLFGKRVSHAHTSPYLEIQQDIKRGERQLTKADIAKAKKRQVDTYSKHHPTLEEHTASLMKEAEKLNSSLLDYLESEF